MTAASSLQARIDAALTPVRTGPRADWVTVLTFLAGLAAGAVHPVGLIVGGLLVGVTAPTPLRALQLGLYLGASTLLGLFAGLFLAGTLGPFVADWQSAVVTVGRVLGLPTAGATVRVLT